MGNARFVFDPEEVDVRELRELHKINVFDQNGNQLPNFNPLRVKAAGRIVYQVPVIVFEDETSGSTTKRWNEHVAIYFSNASLPRSELDKRANVKLLSVSTKVDAHALMDVVVDELIRSHKEPFPVYDCYLQEEVLVRPLLVFCVADNPMAAMLSASIGMSGLYACRVCKAGGPRKAMREVTGFAQFLQQGVPKHGADIIEENRRQIRVAAKGIATTLSKRQTKTGIKDVVTTRFCTELLGLSKTKSERHKDVEVKARRKEVFEGKWYSPLLRLYEPIGFDVCAATPVEILHTFQLGVVKYLWKYTTDHIGGTAKNTRERDFVARLQAVPLTGIANARNLPGKWLVDNAGGLIGKDLKKIVQVASIAFYPLMKDDTMSLELWVAWSALGVLGRLLFAEEITREELVQYKNDLKAALLVFYAAAAVVIPTKMTSKPKFHILLHVIDNIEAYGPAKGFSAERYESFNAAVRDASIKSNRSAPSKDILQRTMDQETIRHLACGGSWSRDGVVCKPDPDLFSMMPPKLRQLYGLEASDSDPPSSLSHIITESGDRIRPGEFSTVWYDREAGTGDVVRLERIFRLEDKPDNEVQVEVTLMKWNRDVQGLLPIILKKGEREIRSINGFDRLLNVAHDCHHHKCQVKSEARSVRMEREETQHKVAGVVHEEDGQQQYLLNHCLFRSALQLADMYPRLAEPPTEQNIAELAVELITGESAEHALDDDGEGERAAPGRSEPVRRATASDIDGDSDLWTESSDDEHPGDSRGDESDIDVEDHL
ncbi:unnamed protein product [Tilletia controversa]|nr:unnamed protein product [Tilletia controversa]